MLSQLKVTPPYLPWFWSRIYSASYFISVWCVVLNNNFSRKCFTKSSWNNISPECQITQFFFNFSCSQLNKINICGITKSRHQEDSYRQTIYLRGDMKIQLLVQSKIEFTALIYYTILCFWWWNPNNIVFAQLGTLSISNFHIWHPVETLTKTHFFVNFRIYKNCTVNRIYPVPK